MSPRTQEQTKMMSASWVNLIVGAVVFLTPFFTPVSTAALWGAVLVGGLIVLLEVYALYAEKEAKATHVSGTETVTLLAGLWLIGYPFFVTASMTYLWISVVGGLIVAAGAAYNLVVANRTKTPRTA